MAPEELREYKRQWRNKRKNDPAYKEKRKQEAKRSYERNKDKINAKRRERYATDEVVRARVAEDSKRYRENVLNTPEQRKKTNAKCRDRYQKLPATKKKAIVDRQREWLHENPEQYEKYKTRKNKERQKRRHEQLLKAVELLGGQCQQCGLVDHPVVYDFHHRDSSTKSFALSQMMGGLSWEQIKTEVMKCDLLCSHCHRKLTYGIE